jgi:4-amino-4-deoxychorismate lyase
MRAGCPLNWARHLARLRADCALLGLPAPAEDTLLAELARVAPAEAVAKIVVTRGAGGRGYAPPAHLGPTRIVAAFPLPANLEERSRDGVRVRRCAWRLAEQPRLAGAKTLNRLENVMARAEWDDPGIAEGLLADAAGRLVEGTMSNVFLVRDGGVATPALGRCGVAGAQRGRVIDLLRGEGVDCEESDIPFEALEAADEAFLTNSLIGAWPVVALDARRWPVGPLARRVQALIVEDDARG